MDEWLCKRLTPAKQKLGKWTGLSHVLEGIWEKWPMPELERYQNLRDSFLANDEDLAKQIAQMGDYFSYDIPTEENRAIALSWRRLELQYKDLELILSSLFRRHFGLIDAEWWPIFAPVDMPYGTLYVPAGGFTEHETKNIPPDGYFLTSRGYVAANLESLALLDLDRSSFYNIAYPLVIRTKPIDRIFMGFLYYIYHNVDFECWTDFWREIHRRDFVAPFAQDGEDAISEIVFREHETRYNMGMGCLDARTFWRLDWHLPMDLLGQYENDLPLETLIPGIEGIESYLWDIRTINRTFYCDCNFETEIADAGAAGAGTSAGNAYYFETEFSDAETEYDAIERELSPAEWGHPTFYLDKFPRYDDCPADFAMCDLPIGGLYE